MFERVGTFVQLDKGVASSSYPNLRAACLAAEQPAKSFNRVCVLIDCGDKVLRVEMDRELVKEKTSSLSPTDYALLAARAPKAIEQLPAFSLT